MGSEEEVVAFVNHAGERAAHVVMADVAVDGRVFVNMRTFEVRYILLWLLYVELTSV